MLMRKTLPETLHAALSQTLESEIFVLTLEKVVAFLRQGGARHGTERFDMLLDMLANDAALREKMPKVTSAGYTCTLASQW